MSNRNRVQVVTALVLVVFAVGIWRTGGGAKLQWLKFYSVAVLVATAALAIWDRFIWRLAIVQRLPVVPRNLRGTWKGTLTTRWENPSTGVAPPPKPAYLIVRQTATTIRVWMFTDESRSISSVGVVTVGEGQGSLAYMYLNQPANALEARSRRHSGSTSLDLVGRPVSKMKGHYWTDRDSRGDLEFVERSRTLADDYSSARALFT